MDNKQNILILKQVDCEKITMSKNMLSYNKTKLFLSQSNENKTTQLDFKAVDSNFVEVTKNKDSKNFRLRNKD